MRLRKLIAKADRRLERRHQRLSYYPVTNVFAWSFVIAIVMFSGGLLMALVRVV